MNNFSVKDPRELFSFLMNLPKIFKLYYRLLRDSRTPKNLKLILLGAMVYVVSPVDMIPGFLIPVLGQLDDIVVLILAAQYFLKKCPPELVAEHTKGIEEESRT